MALDCMHMRYWSGGSSSAQCFSCHRWNKPRDGARTTRRLLWRYFLQRWTSSPPQPLMSISKPPADKRTEQEYKIKLLSYHYRMCCYVNQRFQTHFQLFICKHLSELFMFSELCSLPLKGMLIMNPDQCTACDHNQFSLHTAFGLLLHERAVKTFWTDAVYSKLFDPTCLNLQT